MRTLLRAIIDERHWGSYATFKIQFENAAKQRAEIERNPHLAALTMSERTYERWYAGAAMPYPDARRVLEHLFGHPIDQLLAAAPQVALPVAAPGAHRLTVPFTSHDHRAESGADVTEMGRLAAMAANRALRFAVAAESNSIGPETMDHISTEVRRIAADYPRVPLGALFGDLVEVQDLIFRLLESNRMKPGQARDLNLYASMASGMLAKASHDLRDPQSAMQQARAAYICANQAEHPAMQAWTRGLQSLIAYWAGRPDDAAHYAMSGATSATTSTGTVGIWLAALEARAQALLGDADSVRRANERASDLRDRTTVDDLDDIGGILTFPRPRQLYYGAEAEVLLGDLTPGIEDRAAEAVRAYSDAAPEEWAFGDEAGAQTNLALARLAGNNLDGAAEAVRPVLDLPPAQHNAGILLSIQRVSEALRRGPTRTATGAKELRNEIGVFVSTPTALPR
ncbi:hypothetical protein [Streptomyces fildesensis]|uniref:hypothetical protein n=1 Tax=Streptomyces fildesensis TaxID=375757 RepID=UPI0018DF8223|nr:hypothetical protein [Streptomyces fildesensis]